MEDKRKSRLKGAVAPIITVFNSDESIDEKGTIEHAKFLLENGIQGLIVNASTGESVSMTVEERKRLAELMIRELGDKVPVCIGTGSYRTKDTIELSKHAKDIGADSIMVIVPYYMGPSKTQVLEHYKELAKSVDIPILLYDNPLATGIDMRVQEITSYFNLKLISGIKLTKYFGDPSQVHDLRYLCGEEFNIFYGADSCPLEALLCGADGWISGLLNLIPKACRSLCDAALAGKRDEACEIWERILPLVQFDCFLDDDREPHWLSLIKSGLEAIGYKVGNPRKPVLPLSPEHKKKIKSILLKIADH
jgi:4-hydroxy-tetrahydrodipicolinate synthase